MTGGAPPATTFRLRPTPLRRVKRTMLVTDLGLLAYWIGAAAGVVSVGEEQLLLDWNWSFIGLDTIAIATGLASLGLARRTPHAARRTPRAADDRLARVDGRRGA